jgi:hypothetical protein
MSEVGAAEDDAGAGGGGHQTHLHHGSAVQADAGEVDGGLYGLLEVSGAEGCLHVRPLHVRETDYLGKCSCRVW